MGDCEVLEKIINGLRNASKQILTELPNITRKINQMAALMVQQLAEYEWKCNLMLEELMNKGNNLDLSRVSVWTVPKLVVNERLKNENLFELKDLCKEFISVCHKISNCMFHKDSDMQRFRCKKDHCKECIREIIQSNLEVCPCGVVLSLRDKDSILKPSGIINRKINS